MVNGMGSIRLPTEFVRSITGEEATHYPEPTKAVLIAFSTPIRQYRWNYSTPSFPISTTRAFGIPQPGVTGLKPMYLRMSRRGGLIQNVEYGVLDSRGDTSTAIANLERYRDKYMEELEQLIEAQASLSEDLVIMSFQTGGATSLAHEKFFRTLVDEAKRSLINRRIIPIRFLQLSRDLKDLAPDKLRKRVELLTDILRRVDSTNLVFEWPCVFSISEVDVGIDEVRRMVNELVLFFEELSSYRGEEMTLHRQLSDIDRYSSFYIPSKVMDFGEFERAVNDGSWYNLFPDRVDIDETVLVVHGFTGEVLQAVKVFEEKTKSDRIIAAMRGEVRGTKVVLLTPKTDKSMFIAMQRLYGLI